MSGDAKFDLWYLLALAGAVLIGAVLPVLPTGAAVSAGAVLASHSNPIGLGGVLIAGAAGAYIGDLIVYAGCRFGGERLAKRIGWLRDNASLDALRDRLSDYPSDPPIVIGFNLRFPIEGLEFTHTIFRGFSSHISQPSNL